MNEVALALAASGVTAVAVDIRGHGASGTRGDIAYPGQLDDDLADLLAELRKAYGTAKFSLVGHSAGGGFTLRVAGGPLGGAFDRFVLLAPYLGYSAPTNRPSEGPGLWASPDMPRIIATIMLGRLGVDWPQSLPAIAFADAPEAKMLVTKPVLVPTLAELYGAVRLEGGVRARQGARLRHRRRGRRIDGRCGLYARAAAARGPGDNHSRRRPYGDRLPARGDQGDSRRLCRTRLLKAKGDMSLSRLVSTARFVLAEFGPLIVFWALALTLGVKPAILGSLIAIVADAAWRRRKGVAFTRLYLSTSGLTLVFGAIDLAATTPFMLKYEAAVTNVATGAA
jgi:pimeloyl-ACP methyl ester carboxylesterase